MQAIGLGEDTLVDIEYVELSPEDEKKALLILDASSELAEVDKELMLASLDACSFDSKILDDLSREFTSELESLKTNPIGTNEDGQTEEINVEDFEFQCKCPDCGFEFN